ncbi:MAG: VCBS repeat-containing protein, partial [Pseudomonadota bacterium]
MNHLNMLMTLITCLGPAAAGCSEGDDGQDTLIDTGVDTGADTMIDTTADVPADAVPDAVPDVIPDTGPGPCNMLCGAAAVPEAGTGLNSFSPPGCAGGNFTYAWGAQLVNDAGKSVPLVATLDSDANADIFVNARMTSTAQVFPGNGDGTFRSAAALPAGGMFAGGWGGDIGDFTNDGMLDAVVGDHVSGAVAWKNNGSLSFSLATTGLPSDTLQGAGFADLNGDSNLDVIFGADQFSSGFAVRHGNGSGTWTDPGVTGIPGLGAGGGSN